eukprot:gene2366-4588_t
MEIQDVKTKELEEHINKLKIKTRDGCADFSIDFQKSSEYAQLLTMLGQQQEAIPYYEKAMKSLRALRSDFIWESLYANTGGMFASTLDYLGKIDEAEEIYNEMIEYNPDHSCIGEYAIFLHRRKKNYNQAQQMYIRALDIFPQSSSIHLKYAGFLRHIRKDLKNAENHYKLAANSNPHNADAVGSYASFMHGAIGNMDLAEMLYQEAVQLQMTLTLLIFSMKALVTAPTHANTLYNYAVMLDTHCQRKPEAEGLYLRCLETDPRHPFALYNLAVLLEEMKRDNAVVLGYYERAAKADPNDATTLADYGRFLSTKLFQHDTAETVLRQALAINPTCQVAVYNLGLLLYNVRSSSRSNNDVYLVGIHRKEYVQAETLLTQLLEENPTHAACLQQLGRLYVDMYQQIPKNKGTAASGGSDKDKAAALFEKAVSSYERLLTVIPDPGAALVEYVTVVNMHGNYKDKLRAINTTEATMKSRSNKQDSEIAEILDNLRRATIATVNKLELLYSGCRKDDPPVPLLYDGVMIMSE